VAAATKYPLSDGRQSQKHVKPSEENPTKTWTGGVANSGAIGTIQVVLMLSNIATCSIF
jgi:hypothetical protein